MTGELDHPIAVESLRPRGDFGIYVHVPFCASKCDYCAFATWTDRAHLIDRYLDAVDADIERRLAGAHGARSVFVGGGTPSLVPADRLARLISAIPVEAGAEITVECNPDDVDDEMLAAYVAVGVNRISLGVQSTSPHVLAALGRRHDPAHVELAVEAIRRSGIQSFNLDVIHGTVGESLDDWASTIDRVIELDPPHVAAYALTPEPGTPVGSDPARHPDDDDQADKYELADRALRGAGLECYEVSNWARPGHESVHNRIYWSQGDYLGFGCAAHSHREGRRWWNVRTPDRYVELVERGASVEAAAEELDPDTRRRERRQLALRTADGVERDAFAPEVLERLRGLLGSHSVEPDRVVLTPRGRLLADAVARELRDDGR